MALTLKKIFTSGSDEVVQNYIIESWHVSQSIDAFTGAAAYDITLSGSFTLTGSQYVKGAISASNGANTIGFVGTSSWSVSSSRAISSSYAVTSSYSTSGSYAVTSSYAGNGVTNLAVGAFQDSTTQLVLQNTSASVTFNTTDITDGVSLGVPTSRMVVSKTGTYNFQFSLQIALNAGSNGSAYIWLRKNGSNLPNTNTGIYMQNTNDKHVAAWNFVLNLNAGDYLELIAWAQGADVNILSELPVPGAGGNGGVAVPSAIATVTQIK